MPENESLIPTIEIGKEYLWHYGSVEFKCPHCDWLFYTTIPPQTIEVRVVDKSEELNCGHCGGSLPIWEGWWIIDKLVTKSKNIENGMTCVPYTQLEPIEEESL